MGSKHADVAEFFNVNWSQYKNYVAQNNLCHHEMMKTLNQFLHEKMADRSFSFVDVGCGDGDVIKPVLLNHCIKKYIGIDIAENILKCAPLNLQRLSCEKEFFLENMITAIKHLPLSVDIIFSSYTVHHLSREEKIDFIRDCKNKLVPGGFFLMIDGVLDAGQSREEWLKGYEEYYKKLDPHITEEELNECMRHSRTADYPEETSTFEKISRNLGWRSFQILLQVGLLVFMVFEK